MHKQVLYDLKNVYVQLLLRNGYNSWTRDSLPITVEFNHNDIAMDLTTPQFEKWKIIARYPPPKVSYSVIGA